MYFYVLKNDAFGGKVFFLLMFLPYISKLHVLFNFYLRISFCNNIFLL
jgi:hypothetical protein